MTHAIDRCMNQLPSAVWHFWQVRSRQAKKQVESGGTDRGLRSSVTGGKQMDMFVKIFAQLVHEAGLPEACIFRNRKVELPGFFRPTKQWDILVVDRDTLILAIEAKSQVGPSFGNNFNNRTEEALGSALDLWTAFREGAFKSGPRPWLGYLFLLEDCEASRSPVKNNEPHFPVFPEFHDASYGKRYELLCRKLIRERHYESAAFLLSRAATGKRGQYAEPAADLSFRQFIASMWSHVAARAATRK
jgi:hypothetical protein